MKLTELTEKYEDLIIEKNELENSLIELRKKENESLLADELGESVTESSTGKIEKVSSRLEVLNKILPELEIRIEETRKKEEIENNERIAKEMKKLENQAEKLKKDWNKKMIEVQELFEEMKKVNYRAAKLTGTPTFSFFGHAWYNKLQVSFKFTDKLDNYFRGLFLP